MDVRKRKTANPKGNGEKPSEKKPKNLDKQSLAFKICKVLLLSIPIVIATYFVLTLDFNQPGRDGASNVVPEATGKTPVEAESSNKKSEESVSQPPKPANNIKDASEQSSTKPKSKIKTEEEQMNNEVTKKLKEADRLLAANKLEEALSKYDAVLADDFQNGLAIYGKFQTLNKIAEAKRSNKYLEDAIQQCTRIVDLPVGSVTKEFQIKAGKECAERQKFRGWNPEAMKTLRKLIDRYPDELQLRNDAGVAGLLSNRINDARKFFQEVLARSPNNGFAKVHLGFIMKTTDNDIPGSIPFMAEGIDSNEPGVIDGRFFFHLGDAYYRNGQHAKAYEVYEKGAKKGLFKSMWQRSLYNVDRLASRPWWTYEQTGNADMLQKLEKNWKLIRDEGLAQLDEHGVFRPEDENLRETGDWKQLTLYARGRKDESVCRRVPKTCKLVQDFVDATKCTRGQIKYSVMEGGVHVWPHCGPTNCRIRAHLGLVIPEGPRIRVQNDTRTWQEGKFIIFDDSFEHEVWHDGSSTRLVLIVDMWHPQLTDREKATLSPI